MSKLIFTLCWVPLINYITKKKRDRMGKGEEEEGGSGRVRGQGEVTTQRLHAPFLFERIYEVRRHYL